MNLNIGHLGNYIIGWCSKKKTKQKELVITDGSDEDEDAESKMLRE